MKDEVEHMKLSFTEEEYQAHLNYLKENSLYDTEISVSTDDDILLLQTCYYYPENSFIVVAFRKKYRRNKNLFGLFFFCYNKVKWRTYGTNENYV